MGSGVACGVLRVVRCASDYAGCRLWSDECVGIVPTI